MSSILDGLGLGSNDAPAASSSASVQLNRHVHRRVVIVGPHMSGKRTFAAGLVHAAGTARVAALAGTAIPPSTASKSTTTASDETTRRLQLHGAGVAQCFIAPEPPVRGGSASATALRPPGGATDDTATPNSGSIEVMVVDHPAALHVAIPTLHDVGRVVVLFFIDLADPVSVEEQLAQWHRNVHDHLIAIAPSKSAGDQAVHDLQAAIRSEFLQAQTGDVSTEMQWLRTMLRNELTASMDAASGGTSKQEAAPPPPLKAVCPVRSFVVANKMDVLEKRSRNDGAAGSSSSKAFVAGTRLTPAQYVVQFLRRQALLQCSGFAQITATAHPQPVYRAVLAYLEAFVEEATSADRAQNVEGEATASVSSAPQPDGPCDDAVSPVASLVACTQQAAGHSAQQHAGVPMFRMLPPGCDAEALVHPFLRAKALVAISTIFQRSDDGGDAVSAGGAQPADWATHDQLLKVMEMRDETMIWDMLHS